MSTHDAYTSLHPNISYESWMVGIIKPYSKKGNSTIVFNYRIKCSLSNMSLPIEYILSYYIIHFLQSNNLLSNNQFCFLPSRLTSLQLLSFYENIINYINRKFTANVAYIYILLLIKLKAYGISGNAIYWIQSYITSITQYGNINGTLSPK